MSSTIACYMPSWSANCLLRRCSLTSCSGKSSSSFLKAAYFTMKLPELILKLLWISCCPEASCSNQAPLTSWWGSWLEGIFLKLFCSVSWDRTGSTKAESSSACCSSSSLVFSRSVVFFSSSSTFFVIAAICSSSSFALSFVISVVCSSGSSPSGFPSGSCSSDSSGICSSSSFISNSLQKAAPTWYLKGWKLHVQEAP